MSDEMLRLYEQIRPAAIAALFILVCSLVILALVLLIKSIISNRQKKYGMANQASNSVDYTAVSQDTQDLSEVSRQLQEMSLYTLVDICYCDSKEIIS